MTEEIDKAIVAHRAWVTRFRNIIEGISRERFDPVDLRNDTICAFGRWLHGEPAPIADAAALTEIKVEHRHFHEIAAQIAIMLHQEFPRDEIDAYMTEFDAMSKRLIDRLLLLKAARTG
jgi:methyl-accepting chemotaxis protein